MRRSLALAVFLLLPWFAACAQDWPQASPVDRVVLNLLPTDRFPEEASARIARATTMETGLWVKSSAWVPSGALEPLPGTNQYAGEDYLALAAPLAKLLPDASTRTYFVVLTERDINSRTQNFRFQFSMHAPMARVSVLSVARLLHMADGTPASPELIDSRVQKMLLRIVGEMRLGWKRSQDPTDLMYAPVMSIEDVDRLSLKHVERTVGAQP